MLYIVNKNDLFLKWIGKIYKLNNEIFIHMIDDVVNCNTLI